ncbi:hypothetical protein C8F04DRAFT_1230009 [Mycena alexandri]|uniref:Uncharacterized protein n=1 Tax=Mycena alexandri TaxID=1745969 RepID=A0AAD6T9K0_9AGAR|nr:hypothetical protein C8F04DRAFT_1230009 [Mycena alexandri]
MLVEKQSEAMEVQVWGLVDKWAQRWWRFKQGPEEGTCRKYPEEYITHAYKIQADQDISSPTGAVQLQAVQLRRKLQMRFGVQVWGLLEEPTQIQELSKQKANLGAVVPGLMEMQPGDSSSKMTVGADGRATSDSGNKVTERAASCQRLSAYGGAAQTETVVVMLGQTLQKKL